MGFLVTAILRCLLCIASCIVVDFDRSFGTSFSFGQIFYLAGRGFTLSARGGSPVLFEHLFWFWDIPVYIVILPALGYYSPEVIEATNARKPILVTER
jgi:cytochrome c oxidase subunit 1